MNKFFLLINIFLSVHLFSQANNYWIKFADKNNNSFTLSNPAEFLSQASLDRRSVQNISLDESDLPLNEDYVIRIAPFLTRVVHRLKWFNLIVAVIDNPGMIQTGSFEKRDTIQISDSLSRTIRDSITIHYRITVSLSGIVKDTVIALFRDTLYDTIPAAGTLIIRDSVYLSDQSLGNKFDSIRQFAFIDSMAEIQIPPDRYRKMEDKFEEIDQVDQHIAYSGPYGAAYHQLNMLNGDLLHQMGYKGQGIIIASMDNGFSHTDTIQAFDSVRAHISGTWDFVHNQQDVFNDGGHGTNTFSCMAANLPGKFIGAAPEADYFLFQTEDNHAESVIEEYHWAAAAEVADSIGVQIFTTSLGYTEFDHGIGNHTYNDLSGDKTVMTHASNLAYEKGILVLNSAGNRGKEAWHYISVPADGDFVLSVGAVDSTEVVADFSGRGPNSSLQIKPDICSQGVKSAIIGTDGKVSQGNGTSFSCPIMAGCAACLWSAFPDISASEIRNAIIVSADHFPTPDNNHGYGIPNFYNAYLFLKTYYNRNILRIGDDAVVFPNPFAATLNVSLFNTENKDRRVEIFDMTGRKIYSKTIFIRDKTYEIVRLNPDLFLSAGEYILQLDGDQNKCHLITKVK